MNSSSFDSVFTGHCSCSQTKRLMCAVRILSKDGGCHLGRVMIMNSECSAASFARVSVGGCVFKLIGTQPKHSLLNQNEVLSSGLYECT